MSVVSSGCSVLKENITKLRDSFKNKPEIWEEEHVKSWQVIAEEKQLFYCELLGNRTWDEFKTNELEFLKLKIGFAIFGPSAEVGDESDDEPTISFKNPEQNKTIELIFQKVNQISKPDNVYAAFIFIVALVNNEYAEFPVIRVLNKLTECTFFIDMLGRVYKGWNDFMENNTLPCCICCLPKNGYYFYNKGGNVELVYECSPESSKLRSFLRKIDSVNAVAGFGSAAIGVAALAVPVATPIILGSAVAGLTSGVWSTCRTIRTLVDRKKHDESLSLSDQNARACWLTLAAGILGGASAGAIQYTEFIARSGQALSKIPCIAVNSLEIGSIGMGGLSIINHIVNIVQKKECTLSDSTQLIMSILFFFHASLSFKTSKKIILDIQNNILINVEKELNSEQKNAFISILQETRKNGLMEGNAEVIKSLKKIDNKEVFFQELVGITNEAKNVNTTLSMNEYGSITINDKVRIYPGEFNSMEKQCREKLMESSKILVSDSKNREQFKEDINTISTHENLKIGTKDIYKKLSVSFNEFSIDDKQILINASSDELFVLYKTIDVIENSHDGTNAFDKILFEIKQRAKSVKCQNIQELILLIQNILKKYEEYRHTYEAVKNILEEVRNVLKKKGKKKISSREDAYLVASGSNEDLVDTIPYQ